MVFDKISTTYDVILGKDYMETILEYYPGKKFTDEIESLPGVKYDKPNTRSDSIRLIIDTEYDTASLHDRITKIVDDYK